MYTTWQSGACFLGPPLGSRKSVWSPADIMIEDRPGGFVLILLDTSAD